MTNDSYLRGGEAVRANPAAVSERKPTRILAENRRALEKHRPELLPLATGSVLDGTYRTAATPSGIPNVVKLRPAHGQPVAYYDEDNPALSVESDLSPLLERKAARLVVLLGLGLGYEALHFLAFIAKSARTRRLIIIEADPSLFRLALETTRLEPVLANPTVDLLIGLDRASLYSRIYDLFRSGSVVVLLKAMAIAYTRGSMAVNHQYYVEAAKVVREAAVEARENFGNAPHDSLIGVQNMLVNVPVILRNPGIQDLEGAFKGRPAIIASTGPSLMKSVDQLRELQDRAVLLAPDASLAPLLNHGVRPHILASLERVPKVADLFRGLDARDVYLAACPVISPRAYAAYSGPHIVTYRPFDHFKWLGVERGTLAVGPSAANMAFKIAEFLGCDPIILVGQDLAFGNDGRSHAEGAALGDRQVPYQPDGALQVPGNDGRPVVTTTTWLRFLKHFEYDIANSKSTCINATEGGARIQGAVVMPLSEAAVRYLTEPFDARDVIRSRLRAPDPASQEEGAQRIFATMHETLEAMTRVLRKCSEGARMAQDFMGNWTAQELADHGADLDVAMRTDPLRQLEKVRYEVVTVEKDAFQLFVAHTIQPYLITWQMDLYALDQQMDSAQSLALRLLRAYWDWFNTVASLVVLSLRVLRLGEAVLRREFTDIARGYPPLPDKIEL